MILGEEMRIGPEGGGEENRSHGEAWDSDDLPTMLLSERF